MDKENKFILSTHMMVLGLLILEKDKELLYSIMDWNIQDNGWMIVSMDKEWLNIRIISIVEIGQEIEWMAMVFLLMISVHILDNIGVESELGLELLKMELAILLNRSLETEI